MRRIVAGGLWAWVALTLAERAPAQQPRVNARVVPRTVRLELALAEGARVRTSFPLPRFDTRGQPIKYRPDELKKYKGDDPAEQKLPGYKSDFANLKKGDTVQAALLVPKPDRKNKNKTVWVPGGGTLTGTLVEAKRPPLFVLDVPYAQVQVDGLFAGGPDLKPGTKVPVDPAKAQVSLILILKEAEGDPAPKKAK